MTKCNLSSPVLGLPLFSFFRLYLEQHFSQVSRKGQSPHVRDLSRLDRSWVDDSSEHRRSHGGLGRRHSVRKHARPLMQKKQRASYRVSRTADSMKNALEGLARPPRAAAHASRAGREELERARKLSRQTPRSGSSPIGHAILTFTLHELVHEDEAKQKEREQCTCTCKI